LESLKKRPDESLAFFVFCFWGQMYQKNSLFIKILLRFLFYKTNFINEFSIGAIP
jgi:hypothetical protein